MFLKGGITISDLATRAERNKKWENYWYHYKWHTICGIFLAFCLLIYIGDLLGKEDFDLNVVYVSRSYTVYEQDEELQKRLEKYVPDYDENGEVNVKLYNYTIPEEPTSQEEYDQQIAMLTRFQVEISDGNTFLYIFDEDMFEYFEMEEASEDLTYTGSDKIKDSVKYMLDGTELVDGLNIDGNGYFLVLRNMLGFEDGSKHDRAQENHDKSKEVLENIINNNKINE